MTSQERKDKFNAIINKYNVKGYSSDQSNIFDGNAGGFVDVYAGDKDSFNALIHERENLQSILNDAGEEGDDNYTLVLPASPNAEIVGRHIYQKGVDF